MFVQPSRGPPNPSAQTARALSHRFVHSLTRIAPLAHPQQASSNQKDAATALVFIMALAARIEAAFFFSTAVAAAYTLAAVPLVSRASMHLMLTVMSFTAMLIDGNNAGLIPFGTSRLVYPDAKIASKALMGVWSIIGLCNLVGFLSSGAPSKNKKA